MKLPGTFLESLKSQIGEDGVRDYLRSLESPAPVAVRINPLKWNDPVLPEKVPWTNSGYYLDSRPQFSLDPLWHSGVYYVQDPSSMFLEHVFHTLEHDLENPVVLDLCGAPGGKTTHLASLMNGNGVLIANEVIRPRSRILAENVRKWGMPNVMVTNNDPADFDSFEGLFDLIVADAPCSGEGLFRKSPEAVQEWSENNVDLCASRQQRIIADVWKALKPGGYLIYSTCTYNCRENEENLLWIKENLDAEIISIDVPEQWNLTASSMSGIPGWHFYPHKVVGEGFFISVIRKNNGKTFKLPRKNRDAALSRISGEMLNVSDFFMNEFDLYSVGQEVYALNPAIRSLEEIIHSKLSIVHRGIFAGTISDRKFIPAHDLFLSPFLKLDSFESMDLTDDQAMAMVAKMPFLPEGLKKGSRYRMMYRGVPAGGMKFLGNRVNTTFPQEWRLRKISHKIISVLP